MSRVGVAQLRALKQMAEAPDGIAPAPFLSAPGLINRGLVVSLGRADHKANSAYICRITASGREVIARHEQAAHPAEGPARTDAPSR